MPADTISEAAELARSGRLFCLPGILLGTSSFTAAGWEGSFYPIGIRSKDFLRHYASQFQTVEIDSTFYGTPAASTVTSWHEKTPGDFIFAVKIPQVIQLLCITLQAWRFGTTLVSKGRSESSHGRRQTSPARCYHP